MKKSWDILILLLALVVSFTVPLEIAFVELSGELSWQIMGYLIDLFFLVDIVIQFCTSYFSVEGEEVRDFKRIARRYVQGMFVIDFLSTIPYNLIPRLDTFSFLKILKIARITRVNAVLLRAELKEDQKAMIDILITITKLMLIMHTMACAWIAIVN